MSTIKELHDRLETATGKERVRVQQEINRLEQQKKLTEYGNKFGINLKFYARVSDLLPVLEKVFPESIPDEVLNILEKSQLTNNPYEKVNPAQLPEIEQSLNKDEKLDVKFRDGRMYYRIVSK